MVGNYWPPTLESSVVDVCSQRKRLSVPPFSTRVCDCLYRYRTLLDIYIYLMSTTLSSSEGNELPVFIPAVTRYDIRIQLIPVICQHSIQYTYRTLPYFVLHTSGLVDLLLSLTTWKVDSRIPFVGVRTGTAKRRLRAPRSAVTPPSLIHSKDTFHTTANKHCRLPRTKVSKYVCLSFITCPKKHTYLLIIFASTNRAEGDDPKWSSTWTWSPHPHPYPYPKKWRPPYRHLHPHCIGKSSVNAWLSRMIKWRYWRYYGISFERTIRRFRNCGRPLLLLRLPLPPPPGRSIVPSSPRYYRCAPIVWSTRRRPHPTSYPSIIKYDSWF